MPTYFAAGGDAYGASRLHAQRGLGLEPETFSSGVGRFAPESKGYIEFALSMASSQKWVIEVP